jgi:hypothetical protein
MSDVSDRRVKFDGTINLGHVLTVITLLGGGAAIYTTINSAITQHEFRLDALERADAVRIETSRRIIDRLNDIATDLATIKGRLDPAKPLP